MVSGRIGTPTAALLLVSLPLACVNRGQHAPELDATSDPFSGGDARADRKGTGGWGVDGGIDAAGNGAGGAPGDARMDSGAGTGQGGSGAGAAGAGGGPGAGGMVATGGRGGSGGGGGGGAGAGAGGAIADAGAGDAAVACTARFNFENGNLYGAFVNTGFQTAFSNLRHATDAMCGAGSLKVDVTLSASSGKGELILPLGATDNLAGRTVSVAVKMTPQESPNAYLIVFAVPSYTYITSFSPIPAAWMTSRVTVAADAGATATTAISVQVIGGGDTYGGALLVDEVDVR